MEYKIADHIAEVLDEVVAFRRDLHAYPELSRQEYQTAATVRKVLHRLPNVHLCEPFTETDVVAVLNADKTGRCIALRGDMDALPIEEQTGVPYASQQAGVMHACGHDGHTANLLGAALVLSRLADALPGRVVFIFQPDEEDTGGARRLVEAGVLEQFGVEAAVALHGAPHLPLGTVAACRGPATAANNPWEINVVGRGGHGASPHKCIDPIMVAAHMVTAFQSIVARGVNPLDAGVVTVGQLSAGSACNIIPETARLVGTLRYLKPEVGEHLRDSLTRIAEQTAAAFGARAEVQVQGGYPPLSNDEKLVQLFEGLVCELYGDDNLHRDEPPSLGVEDFAYYSQRVPALMIRLGLRPPEMDTYPSLHSAHFNFNDDALPIGMRLFCEMVYEFVNMV